VAYLRSTQAADGSWSKERSLGISGVVMTALLRTGKLPDNDVTIVRGLRFLESLVNPREGHIAGENPRDQLKNYVYLRKRDGVCRGE
jgi:squalene-hopene/tetraprenyl-beta-curcumene cyclase